MFRAFRRQCIEHGFISKKQCFFRCVGDGVYQTIRVNESCFVDPFSPFYNASQRRSKRVVLGLFSIYAKLPEDWFNPRFGAGTIDARNIIGCKDSPFLGFQDHVAIMESRGFDYLDSIDTQRKLIDAVEKLSEFQPSLRFWQTMCVPYYICHEREKAQQIVDSNLSNEAFIKWCTERKENDPKAELKQSELSGWLALSEALQSEAQMKQYIRENLARNAEYAKKNGFLLTIRGTEDGFHVQKG